MGSVRQRHSDTHNVLTTMRHLTERDKALSEAHAEMHDAHGAQDLKAYTAAHKKLRRAEAMDVVYTCAGCLARWDGAGRLTVCYVSLYEVAPDGRTVWHQEHDRGNEHH